MTHFLDDLDTDLGTPTFRKPNLDRVSIVNGGEAGYEQITCPKCNGRGSKTYGYVNIRTYPCFMCKQTGKVTARRIKAVEAAKKGRETAAANLIDRREAWIAEHSAEAEFIRRNSEWSDFYRSMCDAVATYGHLTDRQLASVQSGMAKAAARKAEKAAAQQAQQTSAPVLDVSVIESLFATAGRNGLKRPVFRALDGIAVSQAPATGRNAGALYVKENGEYAGKIVNGKFFATQSASAAVLPRLIEIAKDPMGQATLYGKQTGICCCCGAELTNKLSIELGIGPICRSKWGL